MQALNARLVRLLNHRKFNLIAFGIIAGMILISYSNTFTADFHFDDNPSIVENFTIKRVNADNILTLMGGARPVVYLSLMLNYALGGLNVVGYHIFNICFHIANSMLVYMLILWTLGLPVLSGRYGERANIIALFVALLFAVHPVQTESVTYIITRTELLAAFFYLATFLFFIKGAKTGKFRYFILCFFTSLLSMASKEWGVTLPAMLLIYDFLFLSDSKLKPVVSRWIGYLLVALPWTYIAYRLSTTNLSGAGFGIIGQNNLTPWTYLLTSFNVLWTYIRLLILPINQNLDYGYPLSRTLFEFPTILSLIGHLSVVAVSLWLYFKKRWTLIPFGVAWYYITLSPTQSFVPILDVIFEHRIYLPSIGFFLVFVIAYDSVFEWWAAKQAAKKSSAAVNQA